MKLWLKILIGLSAGVIVGVIFGEKAEYLQPIGDIFLRLINMLVGLLIFSSITSGITSIHDPKKLGRVGLKTIVVYLCTTVAAIIFGIGIGYLLQPGRGVVLPQGEAIVVQQPPPISDVFLSIFPSNPIAAFAEGNILQVIVFSIFLGMAINLCGDKAKPLKRMIDSLADTMYRLTTIVMSFAPYGVFAIMAAVIGTFGWGVLASLAKFLLAYYLACLIQVLVVQCGILGALARLNPLHFYKGMSDAILMAFSTTSSSATIPVTLHCIQENLGVSNRISSFVVPLGATINMDGNAIFQGMATLFIAQAYGIDLTGVQLLTLTVTAVLSSIGVAGIPGAGYVILFAVLTSVGLPVEGLLVLGAIDRLRDMVSTVINILGDSVTAVFVAKSEGELDVDQYNHAELVGFEESDV